jgi:hypothetical protein
MMETGVWRLAFRNYRQCWSVPYVGTHYARNFAGSLAAWLLAPIGGNILASRFVERSSKDGSSGRVTLPWLECPITPLFRLED